MQEFVNIMIVIRSSLSTTTILHFRPSVVWALLASAVRYIVRVELLDMVKGRCRVWVRDGVRV